MGNKAKQIIVLIIIAAAIAAGAWYLQSRQAKPGPLDGFASCLKDKGAVFYGAFWCVHCQNQKTEFGKSAKLLPYVECSAPGGGKQLQICNGKKIEGYPTWEFADGSREVGEVPLKTLAAKTGCQLSR